MKITKLPPSRWQDYKNLRLEAVADSPQSFLHTVAETNAESDESWQEKITNMFFAVDDANKLVGMAGCYCDTREKLAHIANVVSVYVSPEYRGKGVGRALLMAIIEDAKAKPQVKKLQLGVIITQAAAFKLYESLGFKKIGEQKMAVNVNGTFYDEYLMEMVLDR